ncbi:hypothetical protein [Streptomyces gobitricini]|uniref:hypothetical protein n=1 Tax=Streptomyces gobitricini TaxID=68211 RepID=UPI0031E20AD3
MALSLVEGFPLGVLAWLDILDGRYADGLDRAVRAPARAGERLGRCVSLSARPKPRAPSRPTAAVSCPSLRIGT